MKRRTFIRSTAALAVAAGSGPLLEAAEKLPKPQEQEQGRKLIA